MAESNVIKTDLATSEYWKASNSNFSE